MSNSVRIAKILRAHNPIVGQRYEDSMARRALIRTEVIRAIGEQSIIDIQRKERQRRDAARNGVYLRYDIIRDMESFYGTLCPTTKGGHKATTKSPHNR